MEKLENMNRMESVKIQNQSIKNEKRYMKVKRIGDVLISATSLIILSPVFIIIALLIRVEGKGKIVFGHARLGKDKQGIRVYKFRTMVENADEVFNNFTEDQKKEYYTNFKLDNDPRITRIGNFLRKTSLDELPQLINVLKGDMSIVGPRPIVQKEVEKYGVYADKFFSVIPGVTGHWQANGRSDTTYEERVQMDMYYIDNRSLILDIKIMFQTVVSVIKKEGAM